MAAVAALVAAAVSASASFPPLFVGVNVERASRSRHLYFHLWLCLLSALSLFCSADMVVNCQHRRHFSCQMCSSIVSIVVILVVIRGRPLLASLSFWSSDVLVHC